ncbi:MAG: hypothetical protein RLZZ623_1352 [Actinomycetota bacterium]|jgi:hypothetical protein
MNETPKPFASVAPSQQRQTAMEINSIGLNRVPFPIWAAVATADGVTVGDLGPLTVSELSSVVSQRFNGLALLFAVERAAYMRDEPMAAQTLGLAQELSIVGGKVQPVGPDEVLIDFADLPAAVADLYSWGYKLASVPSGVDPLDVWASLDSNDWTIAPAIRATPNVELFVDSHDDCYLHVETRRPEVMSDLIALLLATAASVAWHRTNADTEATITVPSSDTVARLLGEVGRLVIDQRNIEVRENSIRLPFARERWTLATPVVLPTSVVTYDVAAGSWASDTK